MATEVWGQRFYEQAVARTADETGKRVFRTLVDEETRHLEVLMGQYAAVSGGGRSSRARRPCRWPARSSPRTSFPRRRRRMH
jgi:hypothetical protein